MTGHSYKRMWEANAMGAFGGDLVAFNLSNQNHYKKEAGMVEENALFYYERGKGTQFYNQLNEVSYASEVGYEKYSDAVCVGDFTQRARAYLKSGDSIYHSFFDVEPSALNEEEILTRLEEQIETFQSIYTYFHALQPQYFKKVEEKIKSSLSKSRAENSVDILLSTSELDPIQQEEYEWLMIVKKVQKARQVSEKLDQEIHRHSQRYLYLGTVEVDHPWSVDFYRDRLKEDMEREDISEAIQELDLRRNKISTQKKEVIEKYSLSEDLVTLTDNVAKLTYLRLLLRFGWTKVSYCNIELLKCLVKKNEDFLNTDSVFELRLNEIRRIVRKDFVGLTQEDISQRKESFLYEVNNGEVSFSQGENSQKRLSELVEKEDMKDIRELKGSVASKGHVKGRVRVFRWSDEKLTDLMSEMEKGEILVAGQTRPFLMPAIKKASAIVTDEGGIISHAAIVSRELGIPCVIGTGNATKILKDGDEVEVDADNGTVRILKKKDE